MSAEFETTGTRQVDVHYVNVSLPEVVEATLEECYLENGGLSLEEVLQQQEIMYQSFQTNSRRERANASITSEASPEPVQSGSERGTVESESESSQVNTVESQLASDEAFARNLQELENQLSGTDVSETSEAAATPSPSSTANRERSTDNGTLVRRHDNIDPDIMTYEELQSLGDNIGTESRGLSEELISYLPSFKYKTGGLFSRKEKHEECVICCMEYKNRDVLIALPCKHQYHSQCVTQWLKINKACPVCQKEVFGS